MHRILQITDPSDPLAAKVAAAAAGRLVIETAADSVTEQSLATFDAVLVGDTPLSSPLSPAEDKKPALIQLTRGHHRQIDAATLTRAGIAVAGASPVLASHIATRAFDLATAARNVQHKSEIQHGEKVTATPNDRSDSLADLTVGIVGFGRIGRALAERCVAAGANVIYCDIRTATHGSAAATGVRRLTLDLLLSQSDIVSLHVQWGPTSDPLITERELRLMGRDSVLVNTADARLVDTAALANVLNSGRIGGAGLDIEEPESSQLADAPNTVITPYTAARSDEADNAVARFVVDNIETALSGGEPDGLPDGLLEIVDFPRSGDPAFWSSKMAPRV